jgi:hypothetical protein
MNGKASGEIVSIYLHLGKNAALAAVPFELQV